MHMDYIVLTDSFVINVWIYTNLFDTRRCSNTTSVRHCQRDNDPDILGIH